MAEKPKIWNASDGKIYQNLGPINPVADVDAAHSMALAGKAAREKHAAALETVNQAAETRFGGQPHQDIQRLAASDVDMLVDRAEERVRSNIGGQNIERGKVLFNLVELQPAQPTIPETSRPQGPPAGPPAGP